MSSAEYRQEALRLLDALRLQVERSVSKDIPSIISTSGYGAGSKHFILSAFLSFSSDCVEGSIDASVLVKKTEQGELMQMDICRDSGEILQQAPDVTLPDRPAPEFIANKMETMLLAGYDVIVSGLRGE